ncbi:YraN family protein [Elizabethkingia sp. JS20170427COW]|uniref:YraN family protein n=1 Tax=Elizabethkingia sp. JS20170427COW TaxID=2583851 RepID=UPI001110CEF7|nr:YraN family protein [Elizabethkingia sp. JS20170427COW]QCX53130.1 YraN family protein [Elizabethkingia sp. JS20170427COW]
MANHNDFGKEAEQRAVTFLQQNHFQILARNWRFQKAEIDIIARKGNTIHIVEVKARSSDFFISPEEAVDTRKIKLLISAADAYLQNMEENDVEVQFDIISIIAHSGQFKIDYMEDAFNSID